MQLTNEFKKHFLNLEIEISSKILMGSGKCCKSFRARSIGVRSNNSLKNKGVLNNYRPMSDYQHCKDDLRYKNIV